MRPERWAAAGALADLSDVVLPIRGRFFPGLLEHAFLPDPHSGRPTTFTVPLAQASINIHVWTGLLKQAGLKADDIPQGWEAFWSFWCDTVQPAVRKATGRDDVWGLGLPMSSAAGDTSDALTEFMIARQAYFWPADGRRLVEDPAFRRNLAKALADYTAPWRKGCVPPDATGWDNYGNNKVFLERRAVLVVNTSLSIPAELRTISPTDYYENTATIGWPAGADGQVLPILSSTTEAVVFAGGRNVEGAKDFLRFLLREKRAAAWLEGSQGRWLPTLYELVGSPFWMDPADPHRRPAVEQLGGPEIPFAGPVRSSLPVWWDEVSRERLLGGTVARVVVDGLTPEQAADELIEHLNQLQRQ